MKKAGSDFSRAIEDRVRPGAAVDMSHLLRRRLAEDALGLEHHEHDEDPEDHRLAPRRAGAERVVYVLDDADEETAEDGSVEVADPAEHGRGEGDESEPEARVPPGDAVGLHEEHAGRAREGAAEAEGHRDRAV